MSRPSNVHDMDKLSKAAVKRLQAMTAANEKATVETVVAGLAVDGVDTAPTTLAVLLKKLADDNQLNGFYLRRGRGFVHEGTVPRDTKPAKAAKKAKATKKRAKKAPVITPDALAKEIDEQERLAAEAELREARKAHWRSKLGLAS